MRSQRPTRQQELELLRTMIDGDNAAWRVFHARYDRLIYRCIRKVTQSFSSVLRSEDEREIYGNLIVQLLSRDKRKLRSYDPTRGSRLGTWLGLLATHAAYDYLRAMRREVPSVPLAEAACKEDDCSSPFETVQQRQRSEIVGEIVGQLSNKDRQFVRLYFNRGLSPEAVADAMNISIKTVYSKKHKIQHRLEGIVAAQLAA